MEPYRFEPEAPEGYEEPGEDEDGLTPAILESRSENQITVDECVVATTAIQNFCGMPWSFIAVRKSRQPWQN